MGFRRAPLNEEKLASRKCVIGVRRLASHSQEGACSVLQHFVLAALGLVFGQGRHLVQRTYKSEGENRARGGLDRDSQ